MTAPFRMSVVGDISFEGPHADQPNLDCFADVGTIFHEADLVIGNLECTLTRSGNIIPGKCTLRGSPQWAPIMRRAGIGLVSLANNHVMDYGIGGLSSTLDALSRAGIHAVGAGINRHEACSPLFVDVGGRRIAFLARSSVIVSAPTYAGDDVPGVAFLDPAETISTIRSCRSQADLVILLIHWGLEEYSYPSPTQRQLAERFVDAGANAILGHHPHVLQGFESYKSAAIAYSLGNFVFDEFEWSFTSSGQPASTQRSTLSPANRQGLVATFEWNGVEAPTLEVTCTTIDRDGRVRVDADPARHAEVDGLSAIMHRRWYERSWPFYAMYREWRLRICDPLSFRRLATNLHRIRLRHVRDLVTSIRRSVRIVAEKTTNPYE